MTTLEYKERGAKDKAGAVRKAGFIPAVYYGPKDKPVSISVQTEAFKKVWREAGESGVVSLKSGAKSVEALIYDVDLDPLKGTPRHVDFYVFEKGKKIQVKVPLEFTGVAPAVKDFGGVLVKVMHEIEVEAEPKNLPHSLSVDISALADFKSQILAKDISLPSGVSLAVLPEEVVASVYEPKDEPVEEAPVDLSAIEVEKKGKAEEEGEAGADVAGGAGGSAKEVKEADKK